MLDKHFLLVTSKKMFLKHEIEGIYTRQAKLVRLTGALGKETSSIYYRCLNFLYIYVQDLLV